ncbi:MAG: HAMP domain-containing sensor histidine kinase [Acidobacteriota bacterium]|nr:HAMP domain-containing sensor histidine kinase [Acidobacteriota bacterium]
MSTLRKRPDASLLIALFLMLLLVAVATLQYRWATRISEAEEQRLAASLSTGAQRLADDFDRELTRAFVTFLPVVHHPRGDLEGHLARRLQWWQDASPYPQLIEEVLIWQPASVDALGGPQLVRLRPGDASAEPIPWPRELEPLRQWLTSRSRRPPPGSEGPLLGRLPGLLLRGGLLGARSSEVPWVVLRLDQDYLSEQLLPELVQRHLLLGADGEVNVTVRRGDGEAVFQWGAGVPVSSADLERGLFDLRPFPELVTPETASREEETQEGETDEGGAQEDASQQEDLRAQESGAKRSRRASDRDAVRRDRRHDHGSLDHDRSRWSRRFQSLAARLGGGPPAWTLQVAHPAGSLERAVAVTRRRHLAVSLGVLFLLAGSVLLIVLAARRAQRLARQQMELVAGVTHELYTPLAAIRSAGQNLADGVVSEPQQVRRYGSLVETEGRRLSTMVSRMLELAGLGSGQRSLAMEPVSVPELVRKALDERRQLLEASGIEAEVRLAEGLPPVLGDPDALQRALGNLVENAAKHGQGGAPGRMGDGGGWLGIRGEERRGRRGTQVALTVEDRGAGLAAEDLPHLFEAFYRGRGVSSQVHGSGLGLALVQRIAEAHGGRVVSGAGHGGRGAAFTLLLPAAPSPVESSPSGGSS